MRVAPNVHRVTVGQGAFTGVYAPNVYLVTGADRAAFIDTAYGEKEELAAHLELWETQGRPPIAAIVLTHRHRDHVGGAGPLHKATGGQVVSTSVETGPIERALPDLKVGRAVGDRETIDLGDANLEFIHTPGHTLGSLCVYYREEGVLFTGDTILGTGSTVVSPDHGDMASYIESLRNLLSFDAQLICPGHGPVITHVDAKIRELIEHRLEREHQILGLVGEGWRTVEDLFKEIYTELDPRLHNTARSQVRSHLIKLERDGRVARSEDDRYALRKHRGSHR